MIWIRRLGKAFLTIATIAVVVIVFVCFKTDLIFSHSMQTVTVQLSDDQLKNFSNASYIIFEKDLEHEGYYREIFRSNDITISDNFLVANIQNRMIKIKTVNDTYEYVPCQYNIYSKDTRTINATLIKDKTSVSNQTDAVLVMRESGKKPVIKSVILKDETEKLNRQDFLKSDYNQYIIYNHSYELFDKEGNDSFHHDKGTTLIAFEGKIEDLVFMNTGLDKNEKYYIIFLFEDKDGNITYSKIVKIVN